MTPRKALPWLAVCLMGAMGGTTALAKMEGSALRSMDEISIPSSGDPCAKLVISEVSIPAGGGMNRPLETPRTAAFNPLCYVVINDGLKVHYFWNSTTGPNMFHASGCGEWKSVSREKVQRSWPPKCHVQIQKTKRFGASCTCDRAGCRSDDLAVEAAAFRRHRPVPSSDANHSN